MKKEKYGFVYLWYDRKHKRFYVGCHWGTEDDGYICSSPWMIQAYKIRPEDFKRRILKTKIDTREKTYIEEQRWLNMIKPSEIKPVNEIPRYYNLNVKNNEVWHKYPEKIKTIGEKISAAKTGKSVNFKDPIARGLAISEGKKKAFAKREEELGYKVAPEIVDKYKVANTGKKQSPETIALRVAGTVKTKAAKPKKETPPTMSRKEQDKLCSEQLKKRWSDPVWAERQRERLREGAKNRPPRSEESKRKASIAQKGIPKPKNNKKTRLTG